MMGRTRAAARRETARYSKVRLTVVEGPDKGLSVDAAGRTLWIGTSPDCDVALKDDTVSRRHCEVELTEQGYRVRDNDSTNGVHVGGMRVFDVMGAAPMEVTLGETRIAIAPQADGEDRERASTDRFGGLVGGSPKMRELFALLERLSPTNLSVLLEGETGVGKDVVAESIHAHSERADGPFVVFDCSAVAPNLVENELFGHEREAYTGATSARTGLFAEADGGTLFLDEIGELPKDVQPKLLRALERREVRRIGGRRAERFDVRLLSATNRNLELEVREGRFRQDLYFRLATARVPVPPLRERISDLPALVAHFLAMLAPGTEVNSVPEHVWAMFRRHRWPGNVRELRNAVECLVVAPELSLQRLEPAALAPDPEAPSGPLLPLRTARSLARDHFERDYLRRLLTMSEGNVSRAAARAEVSRQMIQKLMRRHDIRG